MVPNILIVDDEPYMTELIERLVNENTDYRTTTAGDPAQVAGLLDREAFDLAFLDLRMPGMDGLELLREIKRRHPRTGVIIVTAHGTIATAVEALRHGAADFITKPFVNQELLAVMERVLKMQELARENQALRRVLRERYDLARFIGSGPRMRALAEEAEGLARSPEPVLLVGEFGAGKSFLARALHYNGPRAAGPFFSLDLASTDPAEMEPLIFGRRPRDDGDQGPGLLARAEGGTLHLADIGLLPGLLQNRLADWLEDGRFRPSGSEHLESADARLVASAEEEPEALASAGRLEQRLAYHLSRFVLRLPPLRARREDIPLMSQVYLEKYAELHGKESARFSDAALKWLLAHDWPGNLRELENTVERAVLLSPREVIEAASLGPADELGSNLFSLDFAAFDQAHPRALETATSQFIGEFEERYLRHHLRASRGDLAAMQARTGLSAETLREMLARANLSLDSFRNGW